MQSFYDRIQDIAIHYGIKPSVILKKSDIPYSTYHSLSYKKTTPTIETVVKIVKSYPEINFEWLAIGKGSMLIQNKANPEDEDSPEVVALKRQVVILSDRLIEKERYILGLELTIATYVQK